MILKIFILWIRYGRTLTLVAQYFRMSGGDPSGLLALTSAAMGAFVERAACRGHVGGAASGAGTSPER